MDHSINIYKDVITSELCDELIALHKKEKEYTEKEVYGEGANVGCYSLELDDYPEYDTQNKTFSRNDILLRWSLKLSDKIHIQIDQLTEGII